MTKLLLLLGLVVLALVFTLDDATGLGQMIDPIEYMIVGLSGYFAQQWGD